MLFIAQVQSLIKEPISHKTSGIPPQKKMRLVDGIFGTISSILTFALQRSQKVTIDKKCQKTYLKKLWLKIFLSWQRIWTFNENP